MAKIPLIKKELCMLCNNRLIPWEGQERMAHFRACAKERLPVWSAAEISLYAYGGHFPPEVEKAIREALETVKGVSTG